ncbi:MAG: AraC family transcriptional regulator [Polyangiaceae bacterium]|nr:AraC family transcriptional regulator [Polyangiaceae bacterium]
MSVASYTGEGRADAVGFPEDALMLWSGGPSDVTLHARTGENGESSTHSMSFVRRSGMLDVLPRGTTLDAIEWRGEAFSCVAVALDRERVGRLLGVPGGSLDPERGLQVNITDAHVVDLVRRLEAQALEDRPWGSLYVEGLSLTLASYVYARYRTVEVPNPEAPLPMPEAERLVSYVEEHLGADIGLTDLATLVGYSPDRLARVFKKSFGVSPYQYVLRRRVERAKALLRGRAESIGEVAVACGFATQSHFTSAFKARTGLTPRAYRRG